ncbi:MAG TPA: sugar ABC transporter substrate-binding protein [Streptosporangiaceae bacterium]|nr:sugar ABC transporter substrate-binding protein [Streptosporangiaceae bacterium]
MDRNQPQQRHPAQSGGEGEPPFRPLSRRTFLGRAGAAGAALAVAGPILAACGTTNSSGSSGGSSKPTGNRKKIGFSQPDTSASIWAPLMAGAKQECQARGYELLESHANSELDAQLSEIQTWIAEGVGAIIALPLDNNAIVPLIHQAHKAGIKFLDYSDNALPGVDGWVIFDNLQGAKLVGDYCGQWVNKNLGGQAQVGLLTHQIQLTGVQRIDGCVKALQSVAPGAKVVASHEGVLSPDTFPAFQSMLQAHPDIDVAICIADEGCDGVLRAFEATHPSATRVKDMFICGFDGSGPVIKDIESGGPIRATGALDAVAIGKASIEASANAIEGKSPTKINFPYVLCDVDTASTNQKLLAELG